MLAKILGILTALIGFTGIINPSGFKRRFMRRMSFQMKLIVYAFVVTFGFLVLFSAIRAEGMGPKIAGVMGLIITVKVMRLITDKSSEKLSLWFEERSLSFFRIWAGVLFAMGIMLFLS